MLSFPIQNGPINNLKTCLEKNCCIRGRQDALQARRLDRLHNTVKCTLLDGTPPPPQKLIYRDIGLGHSIDRI